MYNKSTNEISIVERIYRRIQNMHKSNKSERMDEALEQQDGHQSNVSTTSKIMKSIVRRNKEDALLEIFLAEFFGTSCLMYFGCMGLFGSVAGVVPLPAMQGGIVFGFVVASLVQAIGHISEAHLNPSVTLAALILGKINIVTAAIYLVAECTGCIFGVWMLQITTPHDTFSAYAQNSTCGFCATTVHSSVNIVQAFAIEFFATAFLVYVVCSVWDPRNAHNSDSTAVKFGLLVAALSIAVGPFTGCSMNPARSLGPVVVSNIWTDHWVYWVAPLSGSLCSTLFYKYCFAKRAPSSEKAAENILKSPDSPVHESKSQNLV